MSCQSLLKPGIFSIPLAVKFRSTSFTIHFHSLSCSSGWNTVLNPHLGFLISRLFGISSPDFCSFFWVSSDNIPGKPAFHYWTRSGGQPLLSFNIREMSELPTSPWGLSPKLSPSSCEEWVLNPQLSSSLWAFLVWHSEECAHEKEFADTLRTPEVTSLNWMDGDSSVYISL